MNVLGVTLVLLLASAVLAAPTQDTNSNAHQISLRKWGAHICGGSIISNNFILTAAHCVDAQSVNALTVHAGLNGEVFNVAQILVHEHYRELQNDVALLRLETALQFSDSIQAIPLTSTETPANSLVTISAWGRDASTSQKIVLPDADCQTRYGAWSKSLLCLGRSETLGLCNNNSDGSAIYNDKLVGIPEFVVGGCASNNPDGYTSVYYYRDWIKQHSDV